MNNYESMFVFSVAKGEEATAALTEKFNAVASKIYAQAQAQGQAGPDMGQAGPQPGPDMGQAGGSQSGPQDDNVVDADYKVVDDDK